jgi:ABC-type Na+ efflux pump permease subunit
VLTFTTASTTPVDQGPGGEGLTLAQLAAADGLARTVASAAQFIGVVGLAVFAISIAGEYSQGTLRNLLVRQPGRVRLLAGKLLALASFTAIAVVLTEVAAVLTALLVAPGQDLATAVWFTSDGWAALGSGLGNLMLATLGWGLLGALLALLLRSPAAAVSARAGLRAAVRAAGHHRLGLRRELAARAAARDAGPGRDRHGHLRAGSAAAGHLRGTGRGRRHHPVTRRDVAT